MIGKRRREGHRAKEIETVRDSHTTGSTRHRGDEIDAAFRKIRSDLRITLWLASVSLVMTAAIFFAVLYLGRPV